jgi:DNA-directed RNA polymerase specialized sigma24 family protein
MPISRSEFATRLGPLRPRLVLMARRLRRCSVEDAEDMVSEVAAAALERLREFDAGSGEAGLQQWLVGILYFIARRDVRSQAFRVCSVPLAMADFDRVREPRIDPRFREMVRTLPANYRSLVLDWLDGYVQEEIAHRNRLHRNTVALRLEQAFAVLRTAFPDKEALEYSFALFNACSRVAVYRKPRGAWRSWAQQHPPELQFRRPKTRRPRE